MKKTVLVMIMLGSLTAFAFEVNSVKEFTTDAEYCKRSQLENERLAGEFIESMTRSEGFKVRSVEVVNCDDFGTEPRIAKVRVIYRQGMPPKPPRN